MRIFCVALFCVSCAHYSMAKPSSTISVPPFTVEAETDLDGAQLAMALVSRLEHFGLNARFGAPKAADETDPLVASTKSEQLDCHVLTDSIINSGNNGVGYARIKLVCKNRGKEFSQILTSGANMSDTLDNRKVLVQSAATEGVENLSLELSKYFISLRERER